MSRLPTLICLVVISLATAHGQTLRIGHFNVDASPPVGGPLAYDPCVEITDPLTFRGVVLQGSGKPIVIAVVDWLGVANESRSYLRELIADRVGTTTERVAVHAIHQHDAPRCDFTSARILGEHGSTHPHYDVPWAQRIFADVAAAAAEAKANTQPVDEIGFASAPVERVASNRRLLDESGKVSVTRYTACRDPKIRALPTGTIDPLLRSVSFYSGGKAILVMTYYATHPQSFYRTGQANPDFPGYARNMREDETGVPHIHFNGAGGNIGAGKWNDGSKQNRPVLAGRVADAMRAAYENTKRFPITASKVKWSVDQVSLPAGDHLIEDDLVGVLDSDEASEKEKLTAAKHLAWKHHTDAGKTIDVQCLTLGNARILHLPGELFVEYQLAAAKMREDLFVATAAYGEYGPGYIGTKIAYSQGGYETSQRASRVGPGSEERLLSSIEKLLSE